MLLFLALAGTSIHAVCTAIVFGDEIREHPNIPWDGKKKSRNLKIRKRSIIVIDVLVAMELALGVAFTALLRMGFYTVGGIVEWAMAFLFTIYFWAFAGFLLEEEEDEEVESEEGERTSLLH